MASTTQIGGLVPSTTVLSKRVAIVTERFKVSQNTVLTVVGWIVSVLLAYGAMNVRVAVIEERVNSLRADIVEIKSDVKTLLTRKP